MLEATTVLGPDFSNHVWSTSCAAINCPNSKLILVGARWANAGKKPSILEKWWYLIWGVVLNWALVSLASSRAVSSPRMVTTSAANFIRGGIVMTGVFGRITFDVITNPATMLPQASRLIGLITAGSFSLIGEKELKRG